LLERAIAIALEEFAPKRRADSLDRLKAERRAVANECDRLANAIARGGPLEALVARLAERQARGEAIDRELVLAGYPACVV